MKKFQYPLSKLRQVRDIEVSVASDALREVTAQVLKVEVLIEEHRTAIRSAQIKLVETETRTGQISPEMRSTTAWYVQVTQQEQQSLERTLAELKEQEEQLHQQVVSKKQSVKMLDKHETRLASAHDYMVQNVLQKESDELWLTRSASVAEGIK